MVACFVDKFSSPVVLKEVINDVLCRTFIRASLEKANGAQTSPCHKT